MSQTYLEPDLQVRVSLLNDRGSSSFGDYSITRNVCNIVCLLIKVIIINAENSKPKSIEKVSVNLP